jgi:hypothetical protein
MHDQLYHLPVLSAGDFGLIRLVGPGLGNLLFPIGRALIGRARLGGAFVYPTMRQLKIGPFLRGEADNRTYGRVLKGRSAFEWRQWLATRRLPQIGEDVRELPEEPAAIAYYGMRGHFHDLAGHRELIGGWLAANAYRSPGGDGTVAQYDIAIHVRLGDFAATSSTSRNPSIQLPMEWYRVALAEARGLAGAVQPRMTLFTDGDAESVKRCLEVQNIDVDSSPNALMAIQRIAGCKVLVASRSTFSMWGAFLGDTVAVWDRRFDLSTYFPPRPGFDFLV